MPGPFAEMTSDCPARFPKTARVRSRAAYAQVFDKARRCHHPALTLHMAPAENGVEEARLGLAVSRKVDARAVGRNRIKRVLRETFRLHRDRLIPGSFVVVAKPAAAGIDKLLGFLCHAVEMPAPAFCRGLDEQHAAMGGNSRDRTPHHLLCPVRALGAYLPKLGDVQILHGA